MPRSWAYLLEKFLLGITSVAYGSEVILKNPGTLDREEPMRMEGGLLMN
jgi:hypothetical protein